MLEELLLELGAADLLGFVGREIGERVGQLVQTMFESAVVGLVYAADRVQRIAKVLKCHDRLFPVSTLVR